MHHSQLVQTLRLLTPEELENVHLFVQSPLFNEANRFHDTVSLFLFLKDFFPDFDDPALEKMKAGALLFPERKNPKAELEKAMSHLFRVLRYFITVQTFALKGNKSPRTGRQSEASEDPVSFINGTRQQLALMRFYSERLFQKPFKQLPPKGKSRQAESSNYLQNLYDKLREELAGVQNLPAFGDYEFNDFLYLGLLLEQEKAHYDELQERDLANRNLLPAMEALDKFYLRMKLDMLCRLQHQASMSLPFEENSDDAERFAVNRRITSESMYSLRATPYIKDADIMAYMILLECLVESEPARSDATALLAQDKMVEAKHLLPRTRYTDLLVMLRSYWSRRYRATRNPDFLAQVFSLQYAQLEDILPDEPIPASHLHNMVATGLQLGRVEAVAHMLTAFQHRIVGASHPDVLRAIWQTMQLFADKQYAAAARSMPHYYAYGELEDMLLYAQAATLNVKICYETGELLDEGPFNMYRATAKRIERDKGLPPTVRAERLRFFKPVLALFKLQEKQKQHAGGYFKDELQEIAELIQANPVVEKEWLLAKLAALSARQV